VHANKGPVVRVSRMFNLHVVISLHLYISHSCLYSHLQSIIIPWLILISRPTEHRRLSWSGWLVTCSILLFIRFQYKNYCLSQNRCSFYRFHDRAAAQRFAQGYSVTEASLKHNCVCMIEYDHDLTTYSHPSLTQLGHLTL